MSFKKMGSRQNNHSNTQNEILLFLFSYFTSKFTNTVKSLKTASHKETKQSS